MSACDELDGRPSHQVRRPQMIADRSAHSRTVMLTAFVSTRPLPIVVATAVPAKGPDRFQIGGPRHGEPGGQDLRRHDGGDRVRRVVEAVDVRENEGRDQDEDESVMGALPLRNA
jgi:hypothetical protein